MFKEWSWFILYYCKVASHAPRYEYKKIVDLLDYQYPRSQAHPYNSVAEEIVRYQYYKYKQSKYVASVLKVRTTLLECSAHGMYIMVI